MNVEADNIIATNTVILTNLTDEILQDPCCLYDIIPKPAVSKLVALQKFKRILIVFVRTADSQTVKETLHNSIYRGTRLKVYYCKHTMPFEYLKVPDKERNFLLSPPVNPPVGWIQETEKEPSRGGILDMKQLSTYSLLDFELEGGVVVDERTDVAYESMDSFHTNELKRDDVICYKSNDSLVYEFGQDLPNVVVENIPGYVPSNDSMPRTCRPTN
jgi:hypothetical protein